VKECAAITDWYPNFHLVLRGARTVVLETRSNCPGFAPWSVGVDGDLFIQYDGKLGPAVEQLLAEVDPANWRTFPDTPEAFTVFPGGRFDLTGWDIIPEGVRRAAPPIGIAYQRYLDASTMLRRLFPKPAPVTRVDLSCDLAANPQCVRVEGEGSILWGGRYEVRFTADFDGREVTRLGLDDDVEIQLRALVASPLFRKLDASSRPPVTIEIHLIDDCTAYAPYPGSIVVAEFPRLRDAVSAPKSARCDTFVIRPDTPSPTPTLLYFPSLARTVVDWSPERKAFLARFGARDTQLAHDDDALYFLDPEGTVYVR
jgi:hypothetical protein